MDQHYIRQLIEKGQVEEALKVMARDLKGTPLEEESFLLYARYQALEKDRAQGLAGWENVQLEHNRIRQAAFRLLSDSSIVVTSHDKKRWPVGLFLALAAILITGGFGYLQYRHSQALPEVRESSPEAGPVLDSLATQATRVLPNEKLTGSTSPKQATPEKRRLVSLSGIVSDKENLPLKGVTVSLEGGLASTLSDENGHFELQIPVDMPKGEARLIYRKEGYQPWEEIYFELPKRDIHIYLKSKTQKE